jgi:hypothetical protein
MTTIIADLKLGLMVADSSITDGDRIWFGQKVYRHKGFLLGFAGDVDESIQFLSWWKIGKKGKTPKFSNSEALVMGAGTLVYYSKSLIPMPISRGIEAIGTGGKAAICTYEALGWVNPVKAVRLVCKHDAGSRAPVRTYKLKGS